MKVPMAALTFILTVLLVSCEWEVGTSLEGTGSSTGRIVDHAAARVDNLVPARVEAAKAKLTIRYWHTSHGSQLTDGMDEMDVFYGDTGLYTVNGDAGLRLSESSSDIGANPDFEATTRTYLSEAGHSAVNVVMWSWCGHVSESDAAYIEEYLSKMSRLEADYPGVRFVYMTGHSDGSGLTGNLHARNQQIRAYCVANNKFLYDFYDIECYDPDGTYYGDKNVTDSCAYDGGNWATAWQDANPALWWECGSAHSQPLNANQKAKAAWQLFARLAESLP